MKFSVEWPETGLYNGHRFKYRWLFKLPILTDSSLTESEERHLLDALVKAATKAMLEIAAQDGAEQCP